MVLGLLLLLFRLPGSQLRDPALSTETVSDVAKDSFVLLVLIHTAH